MTKRTKAKARKRRSNGGLDASSIRRIRVFALNMAMTQGPKDVRDMLRGADMVFRFIAEGALPPSEPVLQVSGMGANNMLGK